MFQLAAVRNAKQPSHSFDLIFRYHLGDSGGPLVQGTAPNEILIGVVSWGFTPCGSAGAPSGVYKRVSAYLDWIYQHSGIPH